MITKVKIVSETVDELVKIINEFLARRKYFSQKEIVIAFRNNEKSKILGMLENAAVNTEFIKRCNKAGWMIRTEHGKKNDNYFAIYFS